jgi:hypothetical protein
MLEEAPGLDGARHELANRAGQRPGIVAGPGQPPDSTRVVITIRETVRARSCDLVAIRHDVEARLDAPLADRELVDGACQMTKYANFSECGPSKPTVQPNQS